MIPFSMKFNPELAQFFYDMKISVAISTYQAGKIVFISASSPDRLIQLPRSFDTPMGMALEGKRFAVSTVDEVIRFTNEPKATIGYKKEANYDAFYVPTATYFTGKVHMHDMAFGKRGLYALNTNFSMLGLINGDYNFQPLWKPPFIQEITGQDQCHLNGMAMEDGEPKYITALSTTNENQGWRACKLHGGVLVDVRTNEIVLQNLQMPHSPRIYKGKLYLLQSASGELMQMDMQTKKLELVKNLKGFVRGMDIYNDYAFIGLSKIRETSQAFADMPIASYDNRAGVVIIHLPTKAIVGEIVYENSVDEIYEIKVMPNTSRANILNTTDKEYKNLIIYPDIAFWAKRSEAVAPNLEIRKYFDKIIYKNITLYDIYEVRDYDRFIIDYWLKNSILDTKEAFKRVSEVATLILNEKQEIIGVLTMYQSTFSEESYYFGRISIHSNEGHPTLWKEAISFTKESFCKRISLQKEKEMPNGIIIEIENKKFDQKAMVDYLIQNSWIQESNNQKNQTVWKYNFEKGKQ